MCEKNLLSETEKNPSQVLRWAVLPFLFFVAFDHMAAQHVEWAILNAKTSNPFHDGIACFGNSREGYGGIDRNGEVVIDTFFASSFVFDNGEAVVESKDGKYGIINTKGNYLLSPAYKYIRKIEETTGLYEITDTLGNKGIYYNNRIVLPCKKYEHLSFSRFPMIEVRQEDGIEYYLNAQDGSIYSECRSSGNILVAINDDVTVYYEKKSGRKLQKEEMEKSSKGVTLYKDEASGMYGIKDVQGNVIAEPQYKSFSDPIWVCDMMIIYTATTEYSQAVVINAEGKEILRDDDEKEIIVFLIVDKNYVLAANGDFYSLYRSDGKNILPMEYGGINDIKNDIFIVKKGDLFDNNEPWRTFNAKTGKFYVGYGNNGICENMMITGIKKKNDYLYGYINVETGKEIIPIYSSATNFSEGVALVMMDDKKFLIDKNGAVVLREDDTFSFLNMPPSEGVIGVRNKVNFTDGYIYNPLGHKEYAYNDNTVDEWIAMGDALFAKKDYVTAKDYFYRAAMNDPTNANAIASYASCLNNLGYYEEAIEAFDIAIDLDPSNERTKKNKEITINNRNIQNENAVAASTRSSSFWKALNSFCSVLSGAIGGDGSGMNDGNSYSGGYDAEDEELSSSSSHSPEFYQTEYARWERNAESCYKTLTNLGSSTTDKQTGQISGSNNMKTNTVNYTVQKKYLREAQKKMREIRAKAAREGITISKSQWETATVSR